MNEKIEPEMPLLEPVDRISELPEHIIHHILSSLLADDVVRTGALSKFWQSLCSSFPISDFSDSFCDLESESA
ncbi:conserved hypothetical protein [Ricinus communis]|uniref:F-box domain-containing protein n=1 Tax=Ricinus communis TaxID=3988 RepID=B9T6Y6_RICCO|nr:conserved hypothetical protein [Ricinus communis]